MKKLIYLLLAFCFLSCNSDDNTDIIDDKDKDKDNVFEYTFSKSYFKHDKTNTDIPYHFFEPKQSINSNDKFPLILALHGAEYFATEDENFLFNETFGYYALAWIKETNQNKYPAYVLAPHIHEQLWKGDDYDNWSEPNSIDFIEKLLEYIINNKNIDPERIYLTGHSMEA